MTTCIRSASHTGFRHPQSGFTLIEIMIVIAIIAVLASIALPSYSLYVTKAKMSEGFVLLGALSTEIQSGFHANSGQFDFKAGESVARVPSNNAVGSVSAPDSQKWVNLPDSKILQRYKYELPANGNRAWVRLQFLRDEIRGCGNQCSLYFGFQRTSDGRLAMSCGRWTASGNQSFPEEFLPAGCDSTCVRCDLNAAR